jgi:hypothetical protein
VLLIIAAVVVGVGLGLILGGSFGNLAQLKLRWWWLALVGLALQLAPVASATRGRVDWPASALLALSFVCLFVFLGANLWVAGVPIVALGILCNALAIAVNGGMPVSDAALRSAYTDPAAYRETRSDLVHSGPPKHHLADEGTRLRPITDVIGLGPPIRSVFSVGDFLAMLGIVWLLTVATRAGPPVRGKHVAARRTGLSPPPVPT